MAVFLERERKLRLHAPRPGRKLGQTQRLAGKPVVLFFYPRTTRRLHKERVRLRGSLWGLKRRALNCSGSASAREATIKSVTKIFRIARRVARR